MKIVVVVVGKEKDFSAYDLVAEYSARIEHYLPIDWVYIPASDGKEEGARILKTIDGLGSGVHTVALDEKGREFTSAECAKFVQTRMNEGLKSLVFVVGGSYGLNDEVRARAQSTIALSKLTFPHQLVRLILAEQLYRACTIMKGEKYHH
ncbi:MAG: 23S rRNA (pseudouridine(1915)-N(3))-methyltransferase RlmH [Candidatus Pacebacteria bacterium]|nr:23S rRNA (pseudouridine(1915)-N(3))-methyltransferase RlmH [Candidatus Paceibacterota bacterium]